MGRLGIFLNRFFTSLKKKKKRKLICQRITNEPNGFSFIVNKHWNFFLFFNEWTKKTYVNDPIFGIVCIRATYIETIMIRTNRLYDTDMITAIIKLKHGNDDDGEKK